MVPGHGVDPYGHPHSALLSHTQRLTEQAFWSFLVHRHWVSSSLNRKHLLVSPHPQALSCYNPLSFPPALGEHTVLAAGLESVKERRRSTLKFSPEEGTQNKPSPLFKGWNWEPEEGMSFCQRPQDKVLSLSDIDSSSLILDGAMHIIYSFKPQINCHLSLHRLPL